MDIGIVSMRYAKALMEYAKSMGGRRYSVQGVLYARP